MNYAPTAMGGEGSLKVPSFEIETYTVLVGRDTAPSSGGGFRIVTLTSVAAFHGIRHHAKLVFSGDPAPDNLGAVTNVDQPNFNGQSVWAGLHVSEYADIYDVLRSEKPVRLIYYYAPAVFDPQTPRRRLVRVRIGTGEEPPGEGPEDLSPGVPP